CFPNSLKEKVSRFLVTARPPKRLTPPRRSFLADEPLSSLFFPSVDELHPEGQEFSVSHQ
ncbi:MAG: hypothetical protein PVG39_26740, partial [Desulfobacteraceae bacterium]